MATRTRTDERAQMLADLLCGAIEHGGYGFSLAQEWHCPEGQEREWFAKISDRFDEDDATVWTVDLDTMARGLGLVRRAFIATDGTPTVLRPEGRGDVVLVNPDTWERLYLPTELRRDLMELDRSNGDEGDVDVVGALAVLEIALFGAVTYA